MAEKQFIEKLAELAAEMNGFTISEEPWGFFYDETQNIRSFRLAGGSVNAPSGIHRDFIVGGVMYVNEKAKQQTRETIVNCLKID